MHNNWEQVHVSNKIPWCICSSSLWNASTYQNLEQPHSWTVVENREWIDEVQDEENHQSQGTGIGRDVDELTVQEG